MSDKDEESNGGEVKEQEIQRLLFACGQVFSPATPVDNRALFAGRLDQIVQISDAIGTKGQHAIIFGERGVGKTSLANLMRIFTSPNANTAIVNCSDGDSFSNVWRKVFSELTVQQTKRNPGFNAGERILTSSVADYLPDTVDPGIVRRILTQYTQDFPAVIIVDEFDRLKSAGSQHPFADTIKDLSDRSVNVTVILVGVARDVDELVQDHASIDRTLVQIKMPRMAATELEELLTKALGHPDLQMTIEPSARELIVMLSQGLPHYTHLLGKEAATSAIYGKSKAIESWHVELGIKKALDKSKQSIGATYQRATSSQRSDTLFESVLLACALAKVDEFGYFSSADVRTPLNRIAGKNYEIPNFSQHLDKFSSDTTRGPVLEKSGTSRRFKFRFINPILQPYVIMKGLTEKKVDLDLIQSLFHKRSPIFF
jgi:energy-coupling factor transporter ATP-binding protein EcfA2